MRQAFRRSLAATIATVFVAETVLIAPAQASVWDARRHSAAARRADAIQLAALPAAFSPAAPAMLPPLSTVRVEPTFPRSLVPPSRSAEVRPLLDALPAADGRVRRVTLPAGTASRVVIHIQDVHGNAEAQAHIAAAVRHIVERRGGIVALEGAFRDLDTSAARRYPDHAAVAAAADMLLGDKRISGPAHAALTGALGDAPVVGIDDAPLYRSNVRAYLLSRPKIDAAKARLGEMAARLEGDKARVFHPDLLAFDALVRGRRAGAVRMRDYAAALVDGAAAVPTDVKAFLAAGDVESGLDFAKAERERETLLARLAARLSSQDTSDLLRWTLAFRAGDVGHADFYRHLRDICARHGLALSAYPAMDRYLSYVLMVEEIDGDRLVAGLASLEKERYARLARTPEERELVARGRRLYLARRLVDFALTPDEWDEYKATAGPEFAGLSSFEDFYRLAEARDAAMSRNLLRRMDAGGARVGILVAGGFHAGGVARRLQEAGVATISYVPLLTSVDTAGGTAALGAFAREKTPLEKLFTGQKLFLAPEPLPEEVTRLALPADVELLEEAAQPNVDRPAAEEAATWAALGGEPGSFEAHDLYDGAAKGHFENPDGGVDLTLRRVDGAYQLTSRPARSLEGRLKAALPTIGKAAAILLALSSLSLLVLVITSGVIPAPAGLIHAGSAALPGGKLGGTLLAVLSAAVVGMMVPLTIVRSDNEPRQKVAVVVNPKNLKPLKRVIEQARRGENVSIVAVFGIDAAELKARLVDSVFSTIGRGDLRVEGDKLIITGVRDPIYVSKDLSDLPEDLQADVLWIAPAVKDGPDDFQELRTHLGASDVVVGAPDERPEEIARRRVREALLGALSVTPLRGPAGDAEQSYFAGLDTGLRPTDILDSIVATPSGYAAPVPQGAAAAYRVLVPGKVSAAEAAQRLRETMSSLRGSGVRFVDDDYQKTSNAHRGSAKPAIYDIQAAPVNGGGTLLSVSYYFDPEYLEADENLRRFTHLPTSRPVSQASAPARPDDRPVTHAEQVLAQPGDRSSLIEGIDTEPTSAPLKVAVNGVGGRIGFQVFLGLLFGGKLPGALADARDLRQNRLEVTAVNGRSLKEIVGYSDPAYPWLKFGGEGSGIQIIVRNQKGDARRIDNLSQEERDALLDQGYGLVNGFFNDFRVEQAEIVVTLQKRDSVGRVIGQATRRHVVYFFSGKRFYSEVPPWAQDSFMTGGRNIGTELVIDATGKYTNRTSNQAHLDAGAKQVLITAPYKDDKAGSDKKAGVGTEGGPKKPKDYVVGVNEQKLSAAEAVFTAASCTTNAMTPVMKALDRFGLLGLVMTTIHAATNTQPLEDLGPEKDLAMWGYVSTSTGFSKAVKAVLPHLEQYVAGTSLRVPVKTVSVNDVVVVLKDRVSREEVVKLLRQSGDGWLKGIVGTTPMTNSARFRGTTLSGGVIENSIEVRDIYNPEANRWETLVFLKIWYDNEYGYSQRVIDLASHDAAVLHPVAPGTEPPLPPALEFEPEPVDENAAPVAEIRGLLAHGDRPGNDDLIYHLTRDLVTSGRFGAYDQVRDEVLDYFVRREDIVRLRGLAEVVIKPEPTIFNRAFASRILSVIPVIEKLADETIRKADAEDAHRVGPFRESMAREIQSLRAWAANLDPAAAAEAEPEFLAEMEQVLRSSPLTYYMNLGVSTLRQELVRRMQSYDARGSDAAYAERADHFNAKLSELPFRLERQGALWDFMGEVASWNSGASKPLLVYMLASLVRYGYSISEEFVEPVFRYVDMINSRPSPGTVYLLRLLSQMFFRGTTGKSKLAVYEEERVRTRSGEYDMGIDGTIREEVHNSLGIHVLGLLERAITYWLRFDGTDTTQASMDVRRILIDPDFDVEAFHGRGAIPRASKSRFLDTVVNELVPAEDHAWGLFVKRLYARLVGDSDRNFFVELRRLSDDELQAHFDAINAELGTNYRLRYTEDRGVDVAGYIWVYRRFAARYSVDGIGAYAEEFSGGELRADIEAGRLREALAKIVDERMKLRDPIYENALTYDPQGVRDTFDYGRDDIGNAVGGDTVKDAKLYQYQADYKLIQQQNYLIEAINARDFADGVDERNFAEALEFVHQLSALGYASGDYTLDQLDYIETLRRLLARKVRISDPDRRRQIDSMVRDVLYMMQSQVRETDGYFDALAPIIAQSGVDGGMGVEDVVDQIRRISRNHRTLRVLLEHLDKFCRSSTDLPAVPNPGLLLENEPPYVVLSSRSTPEEIETALKMGREALGAKGIELVRAIGMGLPVPTFLIFSALVGQGEIEVRLDEARAALRRAVAADNVRAGGQPDKRPDTVAARASFIWTLPGQMETVPNVGMTEDNIDELIAYLRSRGVDKDQALWTAADCLRRLLEDYPGGMWHLERGVFDRLMDDYKEETGHEFKEDFSGEQMRSLMLRYWRTIYNEHDGMLVRLLRDENTQLRNTIGMVIDSFDRSDAYMAAFHITGEWGAPAVIVQAMRLGNIQEKSGSAVAYSRDPNTGAPQARGDYKGAAQGQDLARGATRRESRFEDTPVSYWRDQVQSWLARFDRLFGTTAELEVTIELGRPWLLQARSHQLPQPVRTFLRKPSLPLVKGLGAAGGAFRGMVFDRERFLQLESRPGLSDLDGIIIIGDFLYPEQMAELLTKAEALNVSLAVLTRGGGFGSHTADIARRRGMTAIVSATDLEWNERDGWHLTLPGTPDLVRLSEGATLSIDGRSGDVYLGLWPIRETVPQRSEEAAVPPPFRTTEEGFNVLPADIALFALFRGYWKPAGADVSRAIAAIERSHIEFVRRAIAQIPVHDNRASMESAVRMVQILPIDAFRQTHRRQWRLLKQAVAEGGVAPVLNARQLRNVWTAIDALHHNLPVVSSAEGVARLLNSVPASLLPKGLLRDAWRETRREVIGEDDGPALPDSMRGKPGNVDPTWEEGVFRFFALAVLPLLVLQLTLPAGVDWMSLAALPFLAAAFLAGVAFSVLGFAAGHVFIDGRSFLANLPRRLQRGAFYTLQFTAVATGAFALLAGGAWLVAPLVGALPVAYLPALVVVAGVFGYLRSRALHIANNNAAYAVRPSGVKRPFLPRDAAAISARIAAGLLRADQDGRLSPSEKTVALRAAGLTAGSFHLTSLTDAGLVDAAAGRLGDGQGDDLTASLADGVFAPALETFLHAVALRNAQIPPETTVMRQLRAMARLSALGAAAAGRADAATLDRQAAAWFGLAVSLGATSATLSGFRRIAIDAAAEKSVAPVAPWGQPSRFDISSSETAYYALNDFLDADRAADDPAVARALDDQLRQVAARLRAPRAANETARVLMAIPTGATADDAAARLSALMTRRGVPIAPEEIRAGAVFDPSGVADPLRAAELLGNDLAKRRLHVLPIQTGAAANRNWYFGNVEAYERLRGQDLYGDIVIEVINLALGLSTRVEEPVGQMLEEVRVALEQA